MGKRMIERDRKTPFIRSHKSCVVLGERGFSDFEIQGSLSLGFYKAIRMKVKCYAIFENQQEVLSEYSNPNQRTFLHYDLADTAKRAPSGPNIQQQQSNNGVWYSTLAQQSTVTLIQRTISTLYSFRGRPFKLPLLFSPKPLSSRSPR